MPEFNATGNRRAYGVYRATVTDTDDPEGGARVKVRPTEAALAEAWARVAGAQLPAKGEEVVIAYERGDPRQPYVVGSLWSETGEPPTASRVALRDTNGQRHHAREILWLCLNGAPSAEARTASPSSTSFRSRRRSPRPWSGSARGPGAQDWIDLTAAVARFQRRGDPPRRRGVVVTDAP